MVDTKATTEAKKEHEAKKSALGTLLNTFDGVRELHGCMVIFTTNKPEDRSSSREAGRIELMHFGRLNAIDIMDYWKLYMELLCPLA
jgi:SpoVK/Ycf46/Vps4 family AAA+-type ATPase